MNPMILLMDNEEFDQTAGFHVPSTEKIGIK